MYDLIQSLKLPRVVHFTNKEVEIMKKVEVVHIEPYFRCLNSFEYQHYTSIVTGIYPLEKIKCHFVSRLSTDNKHPEIIIFKVPHIIKVK